ncbi:protein tyrosine phosphatase-like protein ptpla [Ceraceosorus bombacis]|uniref:Protein tyrosine phosphatase-like protein ptpla n=1 Tax=Ceraceosorus bombacis TaxID=401625 RepID=A0A0P1BRC1_9BASI|nr:protein tyrosine phosphatase-like protein ptpla [Ceraceosorus bombacis]
MTDINDGHSRASHSVPSPPSSQAHGLFPSPSYSDSTLASGVDSHLCTPENGLTSLPLQARKQSADNTSARFLGGNLHFDENDIFLSSSLELEQRPHSANGAPHSSLAAALEFGMGTPGSSPTKALGKRSLHVRNDSTSRRHSIQALLPASATELCSASDVNTAVKEEAQDGGAAHCSNADVFEFSTLGGSTGADFLLSPPRLTVSLSSQGATQSSNQGQESEDSKRRRTTPLPHQTPQRSASYSLGQHGAVQQTPPNSWTTMQSNAARVASSAASSCLTQTPYSSASSATVPDSVSSNGSAASRQRRRSIAGDMTSEIAGLTAGLTVPFIQDIDLHAAGMPKPPRSAPPISPENAMQQAQEQAMSANKVTELKINKQAEVWPDDVEVAFWEALRLIPKLGRRKVLVHGKPCGRNELIADYIERKTNKSRSRKQVSSHIQVLKNIKKGDPEFQQLIAEPVTEEDFYIPAGGMMYAQTLASYGYGGLGGPNPMFGDATSGLLSPYTPSAALSNMSLASPHTPSPALSSVGLPYLNSQPGTPGGLTTALNGLQFSSPQDPKAAASVSCPILPASFSMWVHCSASEDKHVYTSLDRQAMMSISQHNAQLPRLPLDSVRIGAYRFPRLAEMYHRLPCQFLYVHVPMSIPRADVLLPRYDHFSTQLSLTSLQSSRLTSVTTVYSHGKRVLSLVEPLDAPRRVSGKPSASGNGTADSGHADSQNTDSSVDSSPVTPSDGVSLNASENRHRFWHQAPFATDFWADFLSRNHPVNVYSQRDANQSFGKEPSERAALGMAVSGVTIIQEFVIATDDNAHRQAGATTDFSSDNSFVSTTDASMAASIGGPSCNLIADVSGYVSPGSKVGDVVLVIAWDLECVEALGGKPGTPTVSMLTAPRMSPSPIGHYAPLPAMSPHHQSINMQHMPAQHRPTAMVHTNSGPVPTLIRTQASPQPPQGPTLLRKRGLSINKPNLQLNIPPAPYLGGNMGAAMQRSFSSSSSQPSPALSTHNSSAWGAMQQRAMLTPITPFPQVVSTPTEPPPMLNHDETKAQRDRLARAWAAQAHASANGGNGMFTQDLNSPLDFNFAPNVGSNLPQMPTFSTPQHLGDAQLSQSQHSLASNALDMSGLPDFSSNSAIGLSFGEMHNGMLPAPVEINNNAISGMASPAFDVMMSQTPAAGSSPLPPASDGDALATSYYINSLLSSMGMAPLPQDSSEGGSLDPIIPSAVDVLPGHRVYPSSSSPQFSLPDSAIVAA